MAAYIAFEGRDGCGKSTHAARLAGRLDAVATREHGGTRIGRLVRSILADPANTELVDVAEALLLAADRAQHLAEVVAPAIAAGRHVVSDRSVYSSIAYQHYGRGLPLDQIMSVNAWAIAGRWPDLVVHLDVPDATIAQRMQARDLDRFELAEAEFFDRVNAGFAAMAAADPARWITVTAVGAPDDVADDIFAAVTERLALMSL